MRKEQIFKKRIMADADISAIGKHIAKSQGVNYLWYKEADSSIEPKTSFSFERLDGTRFESEIDASIIDIKTPISENIGKYGIVKENIEYGSKAHPIYVVCENVYDELISAFDYLLELSSKNEDEHETFHLVKFIEGEFSDIIYFELNNWFALRDYPEDEPFLSWMGDDLQLRFRDDDWVEQNKLVVVTCFIDMSVNFCITAPRSWVEANCPSLLHKHLRFLRLPDADDEVIGQWGNYFFEYKEEYIGIEEVPDVY